MRPCTLQLLLLLAACGEGGEGSGEQDAGIVPCPVGAPDPGTQCREGAGVCVYDGMNRNCPPITGTCECVDGAWTCDPPECASCRETCNGECCSLDFVCRQPRPGDPELECGPEGDATTAMYGPCGHGSDCAGLQPICSPICEEGSCCTVACQGTDELCGEGSCENGVCAPPAT